MWAGIADTVVEPEPEAAMSIIRSAMTAAALARTVIAHPAVRAGIAAAPLLLTPQVKAAARKVTLSGAYQAGVLARKIVDSTRR